MMENRILFDARERHTLLPLTYLRAVSDCRVGMLTIREKWQSLWPGKYGICTADYLQGVYGNSSKAADPAVLINGSILPNQELIAEIQGLKQGQSLVSDQGIIAAYLESGQDLSEDLESRMDQAEKISAKTQINQITYPEDILTYGPEEFLNDIKILTQGKTSAQAPDHVKIRGQDVFIDPTAKVNDCILNATDGPIYIGPNAEIMEYAVLKGPVGIGANSTIHVGAKVYANTFLGPHCKIGGEIKRTTIFGYSNKGHEGFLGDSILTEWCNLGADTNNSNLKNTYGEVSLWDIQKQEFRSTGRQFLGVVLGDHTKCAINTAFMTGSVSGIFASVFGETNPPRFIPNFSWGADGTYNIEKAIEVAHLTMSRRGITPSEAYIHAMKHLASQS